MNNVFRSKRTGRVSKLRVAAAIVVGFYILGGIAYVTDPPREEPQKVEQVQEEPAEVTPEAIKEEPETYEYDTVEAKVTVQLLVEQMLVSPSTAEYEWGYEPIVDGDNLYISTYVDSENSYGAMLRTPYEAQFTKGELVYLNVGGTVVIDDRESL